MPNSLKCKIKHLCHNGTINERERDRILKALEQKWIPVDYDRYPETYPKAFQEVWVTDGYGEVKHKAYDGTRNIKAWMPYIIPEPYKTESESKE